MAVIVFCISLVLRSIDMAACAINPLGTHFLWHLLNAAMLYCTAWALLRLRSDDRGSTRRGA